MLPGRRERRNGLGPKAERRDGAKTENEKPYDDFPLDTRIRHAFSDGVWCSWPIPARDVSLLRLGEPPLTTQHASPPFVQPTAYSAGVNPNI